MKASIVKRQILKNVPSASGIEVIGDDIYVIGDDSPYLFVLDKKFKIKKKIPFLSKYSDHTFTISKKEKPDLEAITSFTIAGERFLLIFGSGSYKQNRDEAFLIEPDDDHNVKTLSLTPFYNLLRERKDIFKNKIINIEAAVVVEKDLFLLHRGNISKNNTVISLPLYSLIVYLQDTHAPSPEYEIHPFVLEKFHGLTPGFSGATHLPGSKSIVFTASLEDAVDEWYDGAIFESMVGIIDEERKNYSCSIILEADKPYKGKVESISIIDVFKNKLHALAVTDSDGSDSEILFLEITL